MSRKKLSKIRRADPFLERELARYEFPLPSREYVIQLLSDEGRPLGFEQLVSALDISKDEREVFLRRLGAMEREGQILRNRKGDYILPEKASLIAGKVQGHPDGYGFLLPDDGSADLFLGVPFNIASYALLTLMVAQVCGLKVGEFIHTFGDAHIYSNHFEQVQLQLSREPRALPQMKLNPEVNDLFAFKFEDFELTDYDPHPHIAGKVAV